MVIIKLLLAVALGIILNPLNSSMIAVALSQIQKEFTLTFADASWFITTYYLASAITQPVMGKLSDTLGPKRLFLFGLVLAAAASLLAPMAPSYGWLLVFRVIQAVGSSTVYPAGMSVIRKVITEKQAKVFGILSIFASTSAALGPSIGGFLIHFSNWSAIFIINVPFIFVSFLLALTAFPKDEKEGKKGTFPDIIGISLFSIAILSLMVFLLSTKLERDWYLIVVCIIVIVFFGRYESKHEHPFINVKSLSENRGASLVYIRFVLVNILFYSLFFGVPSYLQTVHGYTAGTTGMIMLAIAGFSVLVSPFAAKWIDQTGSINQVIIAGAVLCITGTLLLLTINVNSLTWHIVIVLAVLGCGNGLNNLGLQMALYRSVKIEDTGVASGLFMTARYLGTILSSGILGLIFADTITTAKFHIISWYGIILGFAVILLTLIDRKNGQVRSINQHNTA